MTVRVSHLQSWSITPYYLQNGSQTIYSYAFSYAFCWTKSFVFWLKFHWNMFPTVRLMAWNRAGDKAITWTDIDHDHWHVCGTRGGGGLTTETTNMRRHKLYQVIYWYIEKICYFYNQPRIIIDVLGYMISLCCWQKFLSGKLSSPWQPSHSTVKLNLSVLI